MNTPKNTEELTQQIEELVARYVAESCRAVRDAVERAFGTAARAPTVGKPSASGSRARRSTGTRRSPNELAQLGAQLHELVRARPGESMIAFAAELQVPVRALQRPMAALKDEGKIRSVGQRNSTRYFPTVAGKNTGTTA
jgi:hypothetical protein